MRQNLVKRYLRVAFEKRGLVKELQTFFASMLSLQTMIHQVAGQGSGVMEETAELYVYSDDRDERIQLYVVIDNTVNGNAVMLTVLCDLSRDPERLEKVLAFLDTHAFVAFYTSFKERPPICHTYKAYLDEWFPSRRVLPGERPT